MNAVGMIDPTAMTDVESEMESAKLRVQIHNRSVHLSKSL